MRLWRGSKTGLGWSPASLPVEGVGLGDGARRLLTMAPSLLPSNAIVDDERTGWRSGREGEREPKFKNPVASRSSVRQPLATSIVCECMRDAHHGKNILSREASKSVTIRRQPVPAIWSRQDPHASLRRRTERADIRGLVVTVHRAADQVVYSTTHDATSVVSIETCHVSDCSIAGGSRKDTHTPGVCCIMSGSLNRRPVGRL